jgi:Tat protein translocase TatB subunit
MGSLGAPEILVILLVALLVLGPERLPEAARTAGRVLGELRRMSSGFQSELRDAINNPVAGPPAPPAPSADVTPAPAPTTNGSASNGSTSASTAADGEPRFLWSDLPTNDADR